MSHRRCSRWILSSGLLYSAHNSRAERHVRKAFAYNIVAGDDLNAQAGSPRPLSCLCAMRVLDSACGSLILLLLTGVWGFSFCSWGLRGFLAVASGNPLWDIVGLRGCVRAAGTTNGRSPRPIAATESRDAGAWPRLCSGLPELTDFS